VRVLPRGAGEFLRRFGARDNGVGLAQLRFAFARIGGGGTRGLGRGARFLSGAALGFAIALRLFAIAITVRLKPGTTAITRFAITVGVAVLVSVAVMSGFSGTVMRPYRFAATRGRDAGKGFESGAGLHRVREAAGRIGRVRGERERFEGTRQRVRRRFRSAARRKPFAFGDRGGDGAAMVVVSGPKVGGLALQRRDLRFAQLLAALHQRIEDVSRIPVDLVDRPRHHRRLLERLDALRIAAANRFGERVPRANEVAERLLVEIVDLVVERGHAAV